MYTMQIKDIQYIQAELGLSPTGYLDGPTIAYVNSRSGLSDIRGKRAFIAAGQVLANAKGIPCKIDGYWGPNTEAIIESLRGVQHNRDKDDVNVIVPAKNNLIMGRYKRYDGGLQKNKQFPSGDTESMIRFYGKPGKNQIRFKFPFQMYYGDKKVNSTFINKKCLTAFDGWLTDTLEYYGSDEIRRLGLDKYAGCYNNRSVRGGTTLSEHAFACSIDFYPGANRNRWGSNRALFATKEYDEYLALAMKHGIAPGGLRWGRDYQHLGCVKATQLWK